MFARDGKLLYHFVNAHSGFEVHASMRPQLQRCGNVYNALAAELAKAQQCPLVPDLSRDQPPAQPQTKSFIVGQPELGPPQKHVLRRQSRRHAIKPPALREVADRYLALKKRLHRLRRDLASAPLAGFEVPVSS